jgi:RES domain-containing protein
MNPDEVLNGRGTQLYGNRFAKVGTRAVYLADSDRAASNEVLTRKKRLGGKAQITLDKYPRIVFGVDVSLKRVVRWLRKPRSIRLRTVREACLSENELEASMEVGEKLQQLGIQGLLYPSVTGTGRILVVYLDNCDPAALKLRNLDELKKKIAEFR